MPAKNARSLWLAYAGLTLTALFWAGNAVVGRSVVETIPPLSLSFWRWVLAFAILLPFGLRGVLQEWATIRQRWASMLALAAFSVAAFNTLLYLAAKTTTALNIALVNSTIPVMVALLGWMILGARVRPYQGLGIALALTGIAVVVSRGDWQVLANLAFQPGDLLMVAAVACWGLYSVLLRRQAVPLEPVTFLTVQIALGTVVLLPVYLLDLIFISGGFVVQASALPPLLYVAIFPGLLAYLFWNNGVHRVGPSGAAMFMYLTPIFAVFLAGVFLGESLNVFHLLGGVLILLGLVLTTRQPRRRYAIQ